MTHSKPRSPPAAAILHEATLVTKLQRKRGHGPDPHVGKHRLVGQKKRVFYLSERVLWSGFFKKHAATFTKPLPPSNPTLPTERCLR